MRAYVWLLLAWALVLWQHGAATTGDVVLACTLGLSVLYATRDLAIALVDVTQHVGRAADQRDRLAGAKHRLKQLDRVLILCQVPHTAVTAGVNPGSRHAKLIVPARTCTVS